MPDKKPMTNGEALILYRAFEHAGRVPASVKFTYCIAYNKRALRTIAEVLDEANKPGGEADAFDKERAKIAQKFMDADGPDPSLTGGMVRLKDRKGYDAAVAALHRKYPNAAAEMEKHADNYEALLAEPVRDAPRLMQIPFSALPDALTGNVLDVLMDLIEAPPDNPPLEIGPEKLED